MNEIKYYHENMNSKNKHLRKNILNSKEQIYKASIVQHLQFKKLLFKVNGILSKYKLLYSIPWNVTFIKKEYLIENNFPHTHGDTIYFPSSFFGLGEKIKIDLLIHEKIHVYQRYNPIEYNKLLLNYFDLEIENTVSNHPDKDNIRVNPDVNKLIYSDKGEYRLPILNKNAQDISEVSYQVYNPHDSITKYSKMPVNEHPNETIAYYLTENIIKNNVDDDIIKYL